ncbi:theronine dehydrogenase-like Zn-dependent dehydrogenase [Mycobacteroides abscessus subsp. bolletii]|uniref:zinc-dependent alcohol dehydrogenase n=1 Tax=Mycobacteroides abscessus TaxID=36809 RepID=UPI0009259FB5|nr:alcohol dehydrogenase catalytic domain-containing protein [Mycobacteroides abscessus]SIJ30624.1 theronine dehydrogenase-like Zn-dependent dehydrogenase [Mycobacteroides abscessus subsp. bolletii]SLF73415.1 theronine dehydrogenase-like Zn-dependent dehydrogenase [Mycobacteroides abscessus subsp. bolletii]
MAATMTAAVYYGPHDIRIENVPVPTPIDDQVLVRVLRSGICGTDATEWVAGPKTFPVTHRHPNSGHLGPLIPGHEFVGEVTVADSNSGFSVGDLVASGAGVWCGHCQRCLQGRTNLCLNYTTLGLNVNGGMAEYVAVPTQSLRRIPNGMALDHAGLAQPLAVGIHAARRSGARTGDRVAIIGAGAIGSFVLAGLQHLADVEVTVIDFPGPRLERAMRLGAAHTLVPTQNITSDVMAALDGHRPDVVIEASGAPGQLPTAIEMVADGGRVLAVGIPKTKPEIDVHSLVFREITIDSTLAHVCDADLPTALDVLADGQLGAELAERPVPLHQLGPSLDRLSSGGVDGKVLIDPTL